MLDFLSLAVELLLQVVSQILRRPDFDDSLRSFENRFDRIEQLQGAPLHLHVLHLQLAQHRRPVPAGDQGRLASDGRLELQLVHFGQQVSLQTGSLVGAPHGLFLSPQNIRAKEIIFRLRTEPVKVAGSLYFFRKNRIRMEAPVKKGGVFGDTGAYPEEVAELGVLAETLGMHFASVQGTGALEDFSGVSAGDGQAVEGVPLFCNEGRVEAARLVIHFVQIEELFFEIIYLRSYFFVRRRVSGEVAQLALVFREFRVEPVHPVLFLEQLYKFDQIDEVLLISFQIVFALVILPAHPRGRLAKLGRGSVRALWLVSNISSRFADL